MSHKAANALSLSFSTYGDPWMDNAAQNFTRMIREIHERDSSVPRPDVFADRIKINIPDIDTFIPKFKEQVLRDRKRYLTHVGTKKNGEKFRKVHDHVLLQVRGSLSVQDQNDDGAIKEQMWRSASLEENLLDLLTIQQAHGNGEHQCLFCGETFHKAFDNLKQAVYPFVTKIRSLTGVRDRKDYYTRHICPKCYIIGVYEWGDPGLVYSRVTGTGGADFTLVLIPHMNSLSELDDFKSKYIPQIRDRDWRSNLVFRVGKITNMPGSRESIIIAFFDKYFSSGAYRQPKSSGFIAFETIKLLRFASVRIPHGQVKNLQYSFVRTNPSLISLIEDMANKPSPEEATPVYEVLVLGLARRGKSGKMHWDATNDARNRICEGVFSFNLRKISDATMPTSMSTLSTTKEARMALDRLLIQNWRYTEMIEQTELETLKKAGSVVATIFSATKSPAYFKLDRARSYQEMLSALRQLSKKLSKDEVSTSPLPISEAIMVLNSHPDAWREIRDVLMIYSNVFYAVDKYKKEKEGEQSD